MRQDIYIKCPGCLADYGWAASEYWTHGGYCGGRLQLDEYANVHCSRCGQHAHITEMTLSCNSGRHRFYVPPSKEHWAYSFSTASQLANGGGMRWLQSVMVSL